MAYIGPLLTSSPIMIGRKKKKKKLQTHFSSLIEILHHRLPVFLYFSTYTDSLGSGQYINIWQPCYYNENMIYMYKSLRS